MISGFANQATEDIFNGVDSKDARKICPQGIWPVARRKLMQLNAAASLADLRVPPGNRLERLEGDRQGQQSIRINEKYRICFIWTDLAVSQVEIIDYH